MELSVMDRKRIMVLWGENSDLLNKIFQGLQGKYQQDLFVQNTEWDNARQMVEYLAKIQGLIDIKKILSEKV